MSEQQKTLRQKREEEDVIDINLIPEMSVEEVDSFLVEAAPDFIQQVSNIAADKTLSFKQISIDDADAALYEEIDLWKNGTGFRKAVYKVFPLAPNVSLRFKIFKYKITSAIKGYWVRFRNYIIYLSIDGRRNLQEKLKAIIKATVGEIKENFSSLKTLSLKLKLVFASSAVLICVAVYVIYLSLTKGLLPKEEELYLASFSNVASEQFSYEANEVEPYIENARAVQNFVLTKKIVVNLKPSNASGPNPMGAFEFFIEGMSADVVIEVKDREAMVRDLIQRVISEIAFEQLESESGKKELCDMIRKELSKALSTGSVKAVRLKTIVLKP